MTETKTVIPLERIERTILLLRGQKVILDRDLARLYGVETRVLNQAVRRNADRFPGDFVFNLTRDEIRDLSQTVISSRMKHAPSVFAFTEQGVAMLSSVLRSPRAVQVDVAIMRAFVRLRQLLSSHADLARKLAELEKTYDAQFRVVFEAIRELMAPPVPKKKGIGFHVRERRGYYGAVRQRTGVRA
ncbi:MAG: ORF6N domain-containing protein [Verrucomicrobiota bacterium]